MANIRISALPSDASPTQADVLPIDGSTTRKATVKQVAEIGRPAASQAEAETGTDPTKAMTPLTVKQSIAAEVGSTIASKAQGDKADSAMQPATYDPQAIGGDAFARANHTGTQSADTITDGTTNKAYTATEQTKLAGIETAADVTDATNVAAAGAVMTSATDASSFGFVIDEDDMASDSAQKVPTQQSVKAYVDGSTAYKVADRTALKALDTGVHTAALDKEAGFPSPFIWRAGDYSSLVTADPYGGYVNKADAVAATAGAWVAADQGRLIVNPERFGAVSNPAVDNTDAFKRMAAYCDETGAAVDLPPWNILLRDQIVFNGSCTIFGAGRGKTELTWDSSATAEGIKVVFSDAMHRVNIRDLDFLRDGATTGTALHIDGTATVNTAATPTIQPRNGNRGLIENVGFKGATEVTNDQYPDCWAIGCHAESVVGLLIDGYEVRGAYLTATTRSGTAFKLDGAGLPVSTHINNGSIYHVDLCADILHCEGIYITDFEWVAVGLGVKWRTDGTMAKPHLIVGDGHINGFRGGLDLQYINQAMIHDVLFYRQQGSVTDPYLHILIDGGTIGAFLNSIHGCAFSGNTGVGDDITLRGKCVNTNIGPNTHQVGHTKIGIDTACVDTTILAMAGGMGGTGIPTYTNNIINTGKQTKYSGFSTAVGTTVNQSLANATESAISWGTKLRDSGSSGEVWDAANPTRLVAHRTGVYDIAFNGTFAPNATGYRRARLLKNGAPFTGGADIAIAATPSTVTGVSGSVSGIAMSQGDYIELKCIQNSGGALDFNLNATMTLTWVSD